MKIILFVVVLSAFLHGKEFGYFAKASTIGGEYAEKIRMQRPIKAVLPVNEDQDALIIPKSHILQLELLKNLYPNAKFALNVKRTFLGNSTDLVAPTELSGPALTADSGKNPKQPSRSKMIRNDNRLNNDYEDGTRIGREESVDYNDYYDDGLSRQNYFKQQKSNSCCKEVQMLKRLLEREIKRNKNLKKKNSKKFNRNQYYNNMY